VLPNGATPAFPEILWHHRDRLGFGAVRSVVRLLLVFGLLGALLALPAVAFAGDSLVLATEEPAEDEAPQQATFAPGEEPAEVAPPASESDEEQPWTYRFIAPTIVILGVLSLIGVVAYHGVRVRSQYEVVD
jgi:hypothetical protein